MKPKCVITLDLPEDIVAPLERHYDVMAWAKADGLVTKSSVMVGIGESDDELVATLADLAGIGCVNTAYQVKQRRFARSAAPAHRDRLAGCDVEVEPVQYIVLPLPLGETAAYAAQVDG